MVVLQELYKVALIGYPGIARAARRFLGALLMLLFLLACIVVWAGLGGGPTPFPVLRNYRLVEFVVMMCLALILCGVLSLFVWFPIEVNANIKRYFIGYSFYLFAKALALLIAGRRGAIVDQAASLSIMIIFCTTSWYWALQLSVAGERKREISGIRRPAADEEQLRQHLLRINRFLLKL